MSAHVFENLPSAPIEERHPADDRVIGFFHMTLEQAARQQHAAWCLQAVAAGILRDHRGPQISIRQRDALLATLSRAGAAAVECFPEEYPRPQIIAGMEALAALVIYWSEDEERRSKRDMQAARELARMFENDCDNIAIVEQREMRGAGRAA